MWWLCSICHYKRARCFMLHYLTNTGCMSYAAIQYRNLSSSFAVLSCHKIYFSFIAFTVLSCKKGQGFWGIYYGCLFLLVLFLWSPFLDVNFCLQRADHCWYSCHMLRLTSNCHSSSSFLFWECTLCASSDIFHSRAAFLLQFFYCCKFKVVQFRPR